jgi:membrane protein
MDMEFVNRLRELGIRYFQRLNRATGGLADLVRVTLKRFSQARGAEAAASISYYALFSLFPLVLVLVAVAGFVIRSGDAYQTAFNLIYQIIPTSRNVIERNLDVILNRRATIGIIGLIGAVWSATGFFNTLIRNIDRAWLEIKPENMIRTRLKALALVGMTVSLLALSLVSTALVNLVQLIDQRFLVNFSLEGSATWSILTRLVPFVFSFLMFIVLYRWIPNARVRWRACLWGALWTSMAWELSKTGFETYISSGVAQFQLVYGSLGAVVGLMLYIYLSSNIILLGAHLTATIDQRLGQGK